MSPDAPIPPGPQLRRCRPLVRYVDEDQAVIELHLWSKQSQANPDLDYEVNIRLAGPDQAYEHASPVVFQDGYGMVRMTIRRPTRWWPAGMGEQYLYDLTVTLLESDEACDPWKGTIGLTSVRPPSDDRQRRSAPRSRRVSKAKLSLRALRPGALLINGRPLEVHELLVVAPEDENQLLPVGGDCLLLVRGHFGTELLYDSADRAGILLIQSVDGSAADDQILARQVDRLATHPSLAGWVIEPTLPDGAGESPSPPAPEASFHNSLEALGLRLHEMDPTRQLFRADGPTERGLSRSA